MKINIKEFKMNYLKNMIFLVINMKKGLNIEFKHNRIIPINLKLKWLFNNQFIQISYIIINKFIVRNIKYLVYLVIDELLIIL